MSAPKIRPAQRVRIVKMRSRGRPWRLQCTECGCLVSESPPFVCLNNQCSEYLRDKLESQNPHGRKAKTKRR